MCAWGTHATDKWELVITRAATAPAGAGHTTEHMCDRQAVHICQHVTIVLHVLLIQGSLHEAQGQARPGRQRREPEEIRSAAKHQGSTRPQANRQESQWDLQTGKRRVFECGRIQPCSRAQKRPRRCDFKGLHTRIQGYVRRRCAFINVSPPNMAAPVVGSSS